MTISRRARLFILLGLIFLDIFLGVSGKTPTLVVFLTLGLLAYGLFRFARMIFRKSRVIWRLRKQLIVTYMFVGAVPIVLILALTYFGAWIVVGQVATYLVSSELARRSAALESPARFLSQAPASERAGLIRQLAPLLRGRAPGFEVLVTGDGTLRYPPESTIEAPPEGWNDYTGIVEKDGRYFCMALVRTGRTQALVVAPLSSDVLAKLVPGIGALNIFNLKSTDSGVSKQGVHVRVDNRDADLSGGFAGTAPSAYNILDREFIWGNPVETADWNKPNVRTASALLLVTTRTSAVLGVVFGDNLNVAQGALLAFIITACLLAVVELISVAIGATMTRTITGAVHNLYEGTLRIGKGDFSHRIPVKGRDQLADLGNSFNQMTEQLENLVIVAKEKERLQSELDIASEVQNQLFPRCAPPTRTIQLVGACEPARSVSGDYYDYLCLPDGNLALAIGDVAGKGISAALLMASIQSIMRTQLAAGVPVSLAAGGGHSYTRFSTASVVAQLNRQLYANTSPEKYATFFFGLYDEGSRVLTYTNAGHLSPLLVCGGEVRPLNVTGTVVGLFPSVHYEEETISLCAGDLLVAYTDGITEPENAYGEEFGCDRLSESVLRNQHCEPKEIVAKVMEAVKHWSTAPELPDDMTVMVARGIA